MFINHGPCSTARLTLLYYIQAYAKYYILKQRHRYFIVCTQCYCQRVSLQAVGFLVWNHSANKYDIRYVCRLCWQHANFHLHFPFVKLHKKHRQLFAQNSSAKRTACLIVIQVVSRLKQTTRTTASTRINYPRKLLANNAQRNGTAHGNAGADRTGPGSGLRVLGTGLPATSSVTDSDSDSHSHSYLDDRSLCCVDFAFWQCHHQRAEVRVCVHDVAMSEWCSSWPGLVAAEQWNCDRNVSLCAVVCLCLCKGESCIYVCVWVCWWRANECSGNEMNSLEAAKNAAWSVERSTSCEHCKRFAINECLLLRNKNAA